MFLRPANQHIRLIYEGSCDTEEWSNNAENYKKYILKYIKIEPLF